MRVFLIAAVLAVFATPAAAARCDLDAMAKELRANGLTTPVCSCIWKDFERHMGRYYQTVWGPGSGRSSEPRGPLASPYKYLDRANKLANIHEKMCQR